LKEKTRICASILQEDPDKIIESAEKAISLGADLLEVRIDAITDPELGKVSEVVRKINYPLIATNRMIDEGGFFEGSEKMRIQLLMEAVPYAEFVDIELQTKEKLRSKIIEVSRSTIISYHNYEKTPPKEDILDIVRRAGEWGDLAKFAVMPTNIKDTLTVLEVLSETEGVIGISMGELGRYTRLVAPLFGSPITYTSINSSTAPGQLDITSTQNFLEKLDFGGY
jgi:3-dehydroquinate dehydratase-1